MNVRWGSNWDDDLAGAPEHAVADPNLAGLEERVKMEFEQVFMFYLPRICEHCLNPSCVASCPSGAMYKREEDGIVLVDQDRCRGWRFCVSGCPYKKVYFNHRTGKAEKCTFCFPRIEAGQPTICSETCVGRLRYLGPVPLRRRQGARRRRDTRTSRTSTRPSWRVPRPATTPRCRPRPRGRASRDDWIEAAQRSPVYALAVRHRVALPLHPEYRTLPMVWYIPPLSPVADVVHAAGYDAADPDRVFAAIDALRIPVEYLANLFTAGDAGRSAACCASSPPSAPSSGPASSAWTRTRTCPPRSGATAGRPRGPVPAARDRQVRDRYVIPPAHAEDAGRLMAQHEQLFCSLDTDGGPGMGGAGPHGIQACVQPRSPAGSHTFRPTTAAPASTCSAGTAGARAAPVPRTGRVMSADRRRRGPYKLASVLLQYPTAALFDGLGRAGAVAAPTAPERAGSAHAVPGLAGATAPTDVAQHYVRDVRPAPPLRAVPDLLPLRRHPQARHGHAGLQGRLPASAGFSPRDDELPDYLPHGARLRRAAPAAGERLLREHRADLELLRRALAEAESPYADVVEAVCAQLPGLGRRSSARCARPGQTGPPREEVGLEPFAPPEYLAGYRARDADEHASARRELFWWVALPYLALGVFVVGHVWRWRYDQFGWTSRSTQLQERRLLKWGGPLFHYGTFAAIAGHVLGILIPEAGPARSASPRTPTAGSRPPRAPSPRCWSSAGWWCSPAGACSCRGSGPPRPRSTDVTLILLLVIILTGIAPTICVNLFGHGYDYRTTVAPWFRGLFSGSPGRERDRARAVHLPAPRHRRLADLGGCGRSAGWCTPGATRCGTCGGPTSSTAAASPAPPAEPGTGGRKWRKIGVPY